MENLIKKNHADKQFGLGILIIAIGSVFLLRNSGIDVPYWILRWHTIMLGIGLWMGYRKDFKGSSWLALTIIGGLFTFRAINIFDFDLFRISIPMALIGLGLYVILKPKKTQNFDQYFEKKPVDFTDKES
ncbi:LiaF transmembrane domain-containing protein [Pedobacter sp. WC2501]|uniref:LiaF transmembrane domain-containing protein n=1 Tax=Pedobacter sp. WC2501 TaxID=3461400 RepID=UPI004045FC2C